MLWTIVLRRVVRVVVSAIAHGTLLASLVYFAVIDIYGALVALGVMKNWRISYNLTALLWIYVGLILLLGGIWCLRTLTQRRMIAWWEALNATRGTLWISIAAMILLALAGIVLYQYFLQWRLEIVLLLVMTSAPLLVGALQGPRYWIVRPPVGDPSVPVESSPQNLFYIARCLVGGAGPRAYDPSNPQQARAAELLYDFNVDRMEGDLSLANEWLLALPVGLELRIPPNL